MIKIITYKINLQTEKTIKLAVQIYVSKAKLAITYSNVCMFIIKFNILLDQLFFFYSGEINSFLKQK